LLTRDGIGFTDVVKRATAMEKDVPRGEFAAGAQQLLEKLLRHRPALVWLHGRTPLNALCRAAGLRGVVDWGLQEADIDGIALFVTPNPSPANAAFTLNE